MPYQLEVIKFRDLLPVRTVSRFVPNMPEPTLEILGDDLSSAVTVYINEVASPEFIIVSKKKIWAQLPEAARSSIRTIEVVSGGFTKTSVPSKVLFEIGDKTGTLTGILKLVQLFTKWMLQTPGSDIFNPGRGGGLQEIAGKVTSTKKMEPLLATITKAIDVTSEQMRVSQANVRGLPSNERLLGANLLELNVIEDQMEARARISLKSVAGESAVTSLQL
jgi:hypothetical protein